MSYRLKLAPNVEISKGQARDFYTSLLTKSFTEAAAIIGLDKKYTNISTLRKKGWQIYNSINPDELDIPREIVVAVRDAIAARKGGLDKLKDTTPIDTVNEGSLEDIVMKGVDKAGAVLHRKLERIMKSRTELDKTPLSQIATAFGIMFDKRQIITGQATENIAVMAKVSKDMSAEDTLAELLKMREKSANVE